MKKTIKITASFTGTIPTGSYENSKPFYGLEEVLEFDSNEVAPIDDNLLKQRQQELHSICYQEFQAQADRCKVERIANEYKGIRFYDVNGKKYPSVTSILNFDADFHVTEDELYQYGARGTILHKQIEIFLKTGEWKEPKDISEVSAEYKAVIQGNLGLQLDDVDFRNFYKDYPFKLVCSEEQVSNDENRYAGRFDIKCVIESANKGKWAKIDGVKFDEEIILDIKSSTTLDKEKGLTQNSAYAKCLGVGQIGLIHLNKGNECGYSKPVITSNIERYFSLFLRKREQFKQRYGV